MLAHHSLPVTVRFASPQDLVVTRQLSSSHTLSKDLQLIRVYDEPYLLCLSIEGCKLLHLHLCVRVSVCVRACVRACVLACVRACVCVCVRARARMCKCSRVWGEGG